VHKKFPIIINCQVGTCMGAGTSPRRQLISSAVAVIIRWFMDLNVIFVVNFYNRTGSFKKRANTSWIDRGVVPLKKWKATRFRLYPATTLFGVHPKRRERGQEQSFWAGTAYKTSLDDD
jgi:hypothetical protein